MEGDLSKKQAGKRPQQSEDTTSFGSPSCSRCSSKRTKFCGYNNNSLSKPQFFCKNCRLFWTDGVTDISAETSRKRARADVLNYRTSSGLRSNLGPRTCLSPISATIQTNEHAYGCTTITQTRVDENEAGGRVHPLPSLFSSLTLNDLHAQQSTISTGERMPGSVPTTNGRGPTVDADVMEMEDGSMNGLDVPLP